jgi:malate synthase
VDVATVLPPGFLAFLEPLHRHFTPRQQLLVARRDEALHQAHRGRLPGHVESNGAGGDWRIELPDWCRDQRNQMTGPADDAELVVKMLNSGAPGVMLDLEDSLANSWECLLRGAGNLLGALRGTLTYFDKKRNRAVSIAESSTAIWVRPRGLHLHQAGIFRNEACSASLFDVALLAYQVDPVELKHPLAFYIPKSEAAAEAAWWRDLFQTIAKLRGWPVDYIKCMALVESHPLAFEMEPFLYSLREHILGLNLGRWDYMASLIHFNLHDPAWVLPDRNTIPHDVPFFQNLRTWLPDVCHRHGALAIGGMTALFPDRSNPDLNARALAALEKDKRNEAACLMDGAWTGHPDQNQIAVQQFPAPNQIAARPRGLAALPDLRPRPHGIGQRTLAGTRAAVRTVIRYRNGVLNGRGASLLDGYMEDLATDRIYRLMLAQRLRHWQAMPVNDELGRPVRHTPELLSLLFDEELERIISEISPESDPALLERFREARYVSESMILNGQFNPA